MYLLMSKSNIDFLVSDFLSMLEEQITIETGNRNYADAGKAANLCEILKEFVNRDGPNSFESITKRNENAIYELDEYFLTKTAKSSGTSSLPKYKHRVPIDVLRFILTIMVNELETNKLISCKSLEEEAKRQQVVVKKYQLQLIISALSGPSGLRGPSGLPRLRGGMIEKVNRSDYGICRPLEELQIFISKI